MAFRFRQFEVEDESGSQRVGTDAMLLGAWAEPGNALKILDIGTGCGVLALMMTQKTAAFTDAIDIDHASVKEAQANFERSPWHGRLRAIHSSLGEFISAAEVHTYDFIISNPPFFEKLLRSPFTRRNIARHDHSMTHEHLVMGAATLLAPGGIFAVVLPYGTFNDFTRLCNRSGLYLKRCLAVSPRPSAPPGRILMEFSITGSTLSTAPAMAIRDSSGNFSAEYLALTYPFHFF